MCYFLCRGLGSGLLWVGLWPRDISLERNKCGHRCNNFWKQMFVCVVLFVDDDSFLNYVCADFGLGMIWVGCVLVAKQHWSPYSAFPCSLHFCLGLLWVGLVFFIEQHWDPYETLFIPRFLYNSCLGLLWLGLVLATRCQPRTIEMYKNNFCNALFDFPWTCCWSVKHILNSCPCIVLVWVWFGLARLFCHQAT